MGGQHLCYSVATRLLFLLLSHIYFKTMLDERNRLEKEIHSLEQQLLALPSGNLLFSDNGR